MRKLIITILIIFCFMALCVVDAYAVDLASCDEVGITMDEEVGWRTVLNMIRQILSYMNIARIQTVNDNECIDIDSLYDREVQEIMYEGGESYRFCEMRYDLDDDGRDELLLVNVYSELNYYNFSIYTVRQGQVYNLSRRNYLGGELIELGIVTIYDEMFICLHSEDESSWMREGEYRLFSLTDGYFNEAWCMSYSETYEEGDYNIGSGMGVIHLNNEPIAYTDSIIWREDLTWVQKFVAT